jgi:RNA polymerase sigma factor (sigma-70 family)
MKFHDNHFRQFAQLLEATLMGYGSSDEDFTAKQKRQVEGLVQLEADFRQALIRHPQGHNVYKEFIKHIMEKRRNILAARPYFRERQDVFKREISPVLREREHKALYRFNINYPFIAFALKARNFSVNGEVRRIARQIEKARKELIEQNMPLAISRARIFHKITPASHLEYMDLIQISNEGLIAAVDKFVLPYTPVFRAVIIGRITGNLIEDYSETLLHFYPSDKRKLYKAHKVRGRAADMTADDIATRVNTDSDAGQKTDGSEIHHLLSAASHVSLDVPPPDCGGGEEEMETAVDRHEADPATRPDVMVEDAQLKSAVHHALRDLPLLQRKLIRMKGVEL